MSHFYGTLHGSRGMSTRQGGKESGLVTVAASWNGAIQVSLRYNEDTGEDEFTVRQVHWHGVGVSFLIAEGVIGEPVGEEQGEIKTEDHIIGEGLLRACYKEKEARENLDTHCQWCGRELNEGRLCDGDDCPSPFDRCFKHITEESHE